MEISFPFKDRELNHLILELEKHIDKILVAEFREDYAICHEIESISVNGNCIQLNLLKDEGFAEHDKRR